MEQAFLHFKAQFDALTVKPFCNTTNPEEVFLSVDADIKLRTVILKPDLPGTIPVIITRSCYPHIENFLSYQAEEFCKRGFGFVYQFCRGTGGSQGNWEPNVNERSDGKATLDWLNSQDWVESIGYYGSSYSALTGWAVADILPEKVKTLYLTHYGTDRFTSAYKNGLFRQDILTAWAMGNAGFPVEADYFESVKYRPHINVDEDLWGKRLNWYRDWITNTRRSDPYWKEGFWNLLYEIPSKTTVPVYIGEGWYDHHLGSALKTWESLSPKSKQNSTLRIGAWNHSFMPCIEGFKPENIESNDIKTAFDWFESILKTNVIPTPGIQAYRIGADCWEHFQSYPFDEEKKSQFYLSDNKIVKSEPTVTGQKSYIYDPEDPLTVHGAESLMRSFTGIGSLKQPDVNYRDDVLSFVSDIIEQDLDILGKIYIELYVSSDAEDSSFSARLMEVRENGTYNIRGSITTLAFRESEDRIEYIPGTIVKVIIEMWDISWRIQNGSRLRLDISSSCFPEYSVHTNKAGVWSLQEIAVPTKQTIYYGKDYPSKIILPLKK